MCFSCFRGHRTVSRLHQRGGLKPSWHRREERGRSHQSCEVYGLKSGCQSAVTDSVVMNSLLGQSASVHRATSKSSTVVRMGQKKDTFPYSVKHFILRNSLQESVDYVVGHPLLPLWALLLLSWCETPPGLDWGLASHRCAPPFFSSHSKTARSSNLPLAPKSHP